MTYSNSNSSSKGNDRSTDSVKYQDKNPKSNNESSGKSKTSKVNPLNKVKLDKLENMDMDNEHKGIDKSKSNSLKRLDEIEYKKDNVEKQRMDKAKEILNNANKPSESELKALDLDKEKQLKELKRQFDQEINQ